MLTLLIMLFKVDSVFTVLALQITIRMWSAQSRMRQFEITSNGMKAERLAAPAQVLLKLAGKPFV